MQSTTQSTTSNNASRIVFPASLGNSLVSNTSLTCEISSSTPSSTDMTNTEYFSVPAMYISEPDDDDLFDPIDDSIEEILAEEVSTLEFLYEPMDDTSRQLSYLGTLRDYMSTSPAMIWNFYELFPELTNVIFSLSSAHDGLRHSLLAVSAVTANYTSLKKQKVYDYYNIPSRMI